MDKKPIEILEELCKKNLEGSVHNAIPTKQIVLKAMELYAKQEREKEVREFLKWYCGGMKIQLSVFNEHYLRFKETKKQ